LLPLGRLVRAFSTGLSTVFVDNPAWGKLRSPCPFRVGCDWLISPHSGGRPGNTALAGVIQCLFTILSTGFVHNFRGHKKVHSALAGGSLQSGARVCVMPFRERREPVPGGSLSNVLFSRVPEGHNTDPLQWEIPPERVIAGAEPFCKGPGGVVMRSI
jgi:hypothetical protein